MEMNKNTDKTEKEKVRKGSKTMNTTEKTIFKMEQRGSYFVDANGIIKGMWGGFHELKEKGPNGETMYELYHDRYSKYVPINECGYFYNIFSCKKYDKVLKVTQELFLCEKNGREGVIDINGKEILHTCYNKIRVLLGASCNNVQVRETSFIVTCETGDFLYFPESKDESDLYDEISFCYHGSDDYLIIRQNDKYGLINRKGKIIVEPKYEKKEHRWGSDDCELQVEFHGRKYDLPVYNDKFYGKIAIDAYEKCIEIKRDNKTIYIIQKDNKYGILKKSGVLNSSLQTIIEPYLDDVLLNDMGSFPRFGFIIGKKNNRYMLFDIKSSCCIIKNCKKIMYGGCYLSFIKNNYSGFITSNGKIISLKEYEKIEENNEVRVRLEGATIGSEGKWQVAEFFVTKNGKKGVLGYNGEIIIPCDFDEIKYKCGRVYEVVKDGAKKTIDLRPNNHDYTYDSEQESPSHSRYRGSYAQDEMGYSDDDIDTIFDGDPSAYWNID